MRRIYADRMRTIHISVYILGKKKFGLTACIGHRNVYIDHLLARQKLSIQIN